MKTKNINLDKLFVLMFISLFLLTLINPHLTKHERETSITVNFDNAYCINMEFNSFLCSDGVKYLDTVDKVNCHNMEDHEFKLDISKEPLAVCRLFYNETYFTLEFFYDDKNN